MFWYLGFCSFGHKLDPFIVLIGVWILWTFLCVCLYWISFLFFLILCCCSCNRFWIKKMRNQIIYVSNLLLKLFVWHTRCSVHNWISENEKTVCLSGINNLNGLLHLLSFFYRAMLHLWKVCFIYFSPFASRLIIH